MKNKDLNRKIYIYGLYDSGNPDIIRYVGQTENIKTRLSSYIYNAIHPKNSSSPASHKNRWIRKVIENNESISITVLEETIYCKMDEREKYWVKYFGRENLTNETDGGSNHNKWKIKSKIYNKILIKRNLKEKARNFVFNSLNFQYKLIFGKPFDKNDNLFIKHHNTIDLSKDGEYLNKLIDDYNNRIDELCKFLCLEQLNNYYEDFQRGIFEYDNYYDGDILPTFVQYIDDYLDGDEYRAFNNSEIFEKIMSGEIE